MRVRIHRESDSDSNRVGEMEPVRGVKRKTYGGEDDEDKTVKRGCLLNAADSNAIKGAAKILSSFRQSKNVEGSVGSIAAYVIFMEESLYGLTLGSFKSLSYRNSWRKRVEKAQTLSEVKAYLLQLERNIRDIAFSSDWIRHIDETGSEGQLSQSAKSVVGSVKKRDRKPSIVISKIPYADVKDPSTDFAWWRGGMLSKHMIKHTARQGGCKKINGLHYVDSREALKRSKQFIWRAAVDLSHTASELALQVRYLDLHVRWNELVCPEQPLQDGKGLEAEASAFQNACITDKKKTGTKLCYGIVFENQKHLPSRVLKKVLEVQETGDKKWKNWFFEMHIPLYLIKEYEMVVAADVKLPDSDIKHVTNLPKLSKKQLKASGKNLFSFLEQKRENMGNVFCTFCQRDVLFRVAARCSACEGYCHDQCAVGAYNIQTAARIEFIVTCKRCYDIEKDVTPNNEIHGDSPTSPLLSQGQESQHSTSLIPVEKQNGHERPLEHSNPISSQPEIEPLLLEGQESQHLTSLNHVGKQNSHEKPLACSNSISRQPEIDTTGEESSENPPLQSVDQGTTGKENSQNPPLQSVDQKPEDFNPGKGLKKRNKKVCLGLIWKKRSVDDTGDEFRKNNILLKDDPNGRLLAPKCYLCKQPYNSELMYILCESCNNWFHAESVDLQESKVMEVFGFKCCKCRRIRIPICPYTDSKTRLRLEAKKEANAWKKLGYNDPESD
ncbi:putative chromatin regulator PHD family [Helianthus debilis subsp. tardiflorus]